jgi:peptidoglycan/xylan/chitin deacetylase (PgdA/CDA1 family)
LTFDDGLRNNFTVAYPIVRELRVPVTYFVCPGLIESGRWAWNFECRARLSRLSADQRLAFAAQIDVRSARIEAIVTGLKYLPNAARLSEQERLQRLTPDFIPAAAERLEYDIMSWRELKALDPALVTVGGHSCHHEILTRLQPAHLEHEVAECRLWLERELGRPVRHFCYPDGAYDTQVLECVARHFDTAVTTEKDWVPWRPERFRLPRIPGAETLRDLAWRVHRPTA